MKEFLLKIVEYIVFVFTADFATLSVLDILAALAITVLAWKILKDIWKCIGSAFGFAKKGVRNMSAKSKCSKVQCRHCGRSLDRCICASNKGKSYSYRMKAYKKETKEMKTQQK